MIQIVGPKSQNHKSKSAKCVVFFEVNMFGSFLFILTFGWIQTSATLWKLQPLEKQYTGLHRQKSETQNASNKPRAGETSDTYHHKSNDGSCTYKNINIHSNWANCSQNNLQNMMWNVGSNSSKYSQHNGMNGGISQPTFNCKAHEVAKDI